MSGLVCQYSAVGKPSFHENPRTFFFFFCSLSEFYQAEIGLEKKCSFWRDRPASSETIHPMGSLGPELAVSFATSCAEGTLRFL